MNFMKLLHINYPRAALTVGLRFVLSVYDEGELKVLADRTWPRILFKGSLGLAGPGFVRGGRKNPGGQARAAAKLWSEEGRASKTVFLPLVATLHLRRCGSRTRASG